MKERPKSVKAVIDQAEAQKTIQQAAGKGGKHDPFSDGKAKLSPEGVGRLKYIGGRK